MASLVGKVYAVTGAASGIGLATARILASRGASVCIGDLNGESLDAAETALSPRAKDRITSLRTDIGERSNVAAFIDHTIKTFGGLDGFANVAAITGPGLNTRNIWEMDNQELTSVMRVNVEGTFNCLAELLKPGVLQSGASIVNVASLRGARGCGKGSVYSASKHAVIGLTRSAAIEAGPRNIRVNAVAPGVIETPMLLAALSGDTSGPETPKGITPLPRFGKPVEAGNIIAFLLNDESSFVTGSTYFVDGGWNAI